MRSGRIGARRRPAYGTVGKITGTGLRPATISATSDRSHANSARSVAATAPSGGASRKSVIAPSRKAFCPNSSTRQVLVHGHLACHLGDRPAAIDHPTSSLHLELGELGRMTTDAPWTRRILPAGPVVCGSRSSPGSNAPTTDGAGRPASADCHPSSSRPFSTRPPPRHDTGPAPVGAAVPPTGDDVVRLGVRAPGSESLALARMGAGDPPGCVDHTKYRVEHLSWLP